jgi:hypothetical protein
VQGHSVVEIAGTLLVADGQELLFVLVVVKFVVEGVKILRSILVLPEWTTLSWLVNLQRR